MESPRHRVGRADRDQHGAEQFRNRHGADADSQRSDQRAGLRVEKLDGRDHSIGDD